MEKIIRRKDLPVFTGLTKSTLERMISAGTFPKPVRLSERAVGWKESAITEWQKSREEVQ